MDFQKASKLSAQYKHVFGTADGQAVLDDLLIYCGIIPDPDELKRGVNTTLIDIGMDLDGYGARAERHNMGQYIQGMISEEQ